MPQYWVNLPGGGQKLVNASSQSAAIGNAGGGSIASAPTRTAPAPAPAPKAAPAPAPMASAPLPAALGDTDQQSVRADLRNQGYYIDASGVYAPGAGQRVGDTFSGSMANQNVAPSPTRLPVINGTPVSPSNGTTGPQTGAIMYRGDPQYATYFGPGTPGYSSTSQTYNATPTALPAGQHTLEEMSSSPQPAQSGGAPAQAGRPAGTTNGIEGGIPLGGGGASGASGAQATDQAAWMAGVTSQNPAGGFGPYMTAEAPVLEDQGQYVENGQIIKKSVDQYGHPYYQTIGPAASAQPSQPAPATGTPATGAPQPAAPTPAAPGQPAANGDTVPLTLPNGDVVMVPKSFYQEYLDAAQKQADAAKQATQFTQGIQQGQLDVQRLVATYQKAYQDALIAGQTAQRAQDLALAQMKSDLDKQTLELNKTIAANTALYQQQQLENQRSQQSQTLSLEREKLDLQRRQMRGRRLPQVRYA